MTAVTEEHLGDAVSDLRARLEGVLALPGEPGYDRITPWNMTVPVRPRMVVFVASATDVSAVVRFAADHGLRVAVQCTGHGALPGVGADTILVHTGALSGCEVDVRNRMARVGAGARWQQVFDAVCPHGLAPLSGSAPGVGVAGFLTGAGIGPLVRTFGASSDYVRAFELVTGTGEILRVTPETYPDLYWGVRGSKSTLGIVTSVEIDLLPITEFYGGALYFNGADAEAVLHEWARWSAGLPETVNTSIALQQLPAVPGVPAVLAGRLTVAVRYCALGDPGEAARLLAPMRAVATPVLDTVAQQPFAALGAVHADPVDPMPVHEGHALLRALPAEAVDALLAVAGSESGSVQTVVELRLLGGALAREPRHASALRHRDAAYSMCLIGAPVGPVAEQVVAHSRAVVAAMAPWATGGQFPNFAPEAGAERLRRCYDEDTLHWLGQLANRYDPVGILAVGQVARL